MWEILILILSQQENQCGYNYSRAELQDFSLFQSGKDAGRKQNYLWSICTESEGHSYLV